VGPTIAHVDVQATFSIHLDGYGLLCEFRSLMFASPTRATVIVKGIRLGSYFAPTI